jgi:alpha-L-fucosidase 2
LRWRGGKLESAEMRSLAGLRCRARVRLPVVVKSGGKAIKIERPEPGVIVFETEAGKSYTVEPSNAADRQ